MESYGIVQKIIDVHKTGAKTRLKTNIILEK